MLLLLQPTTRRRAHSMARPWVPIQLFAPNITSANSVAIAEQKPVYLSSVFCTSCSPFPLTCHLMCVNESSDSRGSVTSISTTMTSQLQPKLCKKLDRFKRSNKKPTVNTNPLLHSTAHCRTIIIIIIIFRPPMSIITIQIIGTAVCIVSKHVVTL